MLYIRTWMRILVLGALLLLIAGQLGFRSEWFQKKYVYPFPYCDIVYRYSLERELDPYLIAGVIRAESKFIAQAQSPKGAAGLMQMMPDTGRWVAGQLSYGPFNPQDLYDPEVNIKFGTWYLASLKKEFAGNEVLMLAAYNGGRGNVKQWMRQNDWTYDFNDVNQIPFRETRDYVGRVLNNKQRYNELYGR